MLKVKTQRSGELFVKNMLMFHLYMVIIKMYKVKNFFIKFLEISRKTGINFLKFSIGNIHSTFYAHQLIYCKLDKRYILSHMKKMIAYSQELDSIYNSYT